MEKVLFIYTRIPDGQFCPPSFGNSIHFAVSERGEEYIPLNQNRGILYAKGEVSPENQIIEKGLAEPEAYPLPDGGFAILAKRTGQDGSVENNGEAEWLLWLTQDFISFEECGLTDLSQHPMLKELRAGEVKSHPPYPFPDVAAGCWLPIETGLYKKLLRYYTPVCNTHMDIPKEISASCVEEIKDLSFTAHYSDGTTAQKKYDIPDVAQIDFAHPGTYTATAVVRQKPYSFPLAVGFADPVIFFWDNKYYYIATNDNTDDVGFWVREAAQVEDLFLPDAAQHLILDKDEEKKRLQTFWAPEFHVIGNRVYLLFAVSGDTINPQCHMMRLKENGSVTSADGWEEPVRVKKMDGTFLAVNGITLDMTHFENGGRSYLIWSYRENCMAEGDTGSMLYIAETNPDRPWMLKSDPVLLSRPLYGWENVAGTINNEGPYPLITQEYIYIAFSGGAACDWTYTVGLLRAGRDADLLDPESWEKSKFPALATPDLDGVYGAGHNSFFKDRDGDTYIAYHGEITPYHSPRSTALHRVHFRETGEPVLNLSYERDIKEEYRKVNLNITVTGHE